MITLETKNLHAGILGAHAAIHSTATYCCMTWLLLLLLSATATAGTVYKCTDAKGHTSFQDAPCSRHNQQQTLNLPTPPARNATVAPTAKASIPPPDPLPQRPPAPIPAPAPVTIPQLYRCLRATDGKSYVSRNGHPRAYLVPLGILGAFRLPLSNTYGGKGAAQRAASDPQLARGRITQPLIAGSYTWVQDRCQPMSPYQICQTLADQLADVEDSIYKAFRSEQPPLQRQAASLRKDMSGCPR